MSAALNLQITNTTDATRGQPLAARVYQRKDELEDALAELGPREMLLKHAVETALATIYSLMTGDITHPGEVVARDMSRWLERNKHLAQDITLAKRR